jgi:hypothetical protein
MAEHSQLRDGRTIRFEDGWPDMCAVLEDNGVEIGSARVPRPSAGYGGHDLIVSPHESYAAVYIFSGQSQDGYELFELRPTLRRLEGVPYVRGEGGLLAFSSDEHWLAFATSVNPALTDALGDGATSERLTRWLELRMQELPRGPIVVSIVAVRFAVDVEVGGDAIFYPESMEFVSPMRVRITAPWGGSVTVSAPGSELVIMRGPPH